MKVAAYLKKYLDEKGVANIEEAVLAAERLTSAEIVPVIARSSSTTGHVHAAVFLLIVSLLVFFIPNRELTFLVPATLLTYYLSHALASLPFLQRLFTPKADQDKQVEMRASQLFYDLHLHHSQKRTGVLIFVSLLERKVSILADKKLSLVLEEDAFKQMIEAFLERLKKSEMELGFKEAILSLAKKLEKDFPTVEGKNELENHLIMLE